MGTSFNKALAGFAVAVLGAAQNSFGGYVGLDAGTVNAIFAAATGLIVYLVPNAK